MLKILKVFIEGRTIKSADLFSLYRLKMELPAGIRLDLYSSLCMTILTAELGTRIQVSLCQFKLFIQFMYMTVL